MFKSKSVPVNLNDYEQTLVPFRPISSRDKISIKTYEFKGEIPLGICYDEINNKIVITDIIKDSIVDLKYKDICIGMELISINNHPIKKYDKTMNYIKTKYKLHKYIKLTFLKVNKKNISEVFEIEE